MSNHRNKTQNPGCEFKKIYEKNTIVLLIKFEMNWRKTDSPIDIQMSWLLLMCVKGNNKKVLKKFEIKAFTIKRWPWHKNDDKKLLRKFLRCIRS